MKKILSVLLSLSLVLTMIPSLAMADSTDYSGKTVILYTGNLRGDVDMYAKMAKAKKDFEDKKADAVYLVDAGNYLQGKTYANATRGEMVYDLMSAAGYDAAAMGAYEFAYADATTGQKYHSNLTKYYTQKMLYKGLESDLSYRVNPPREEVAKTKTLKAKAHAPFKVISSNITGTSSVAVDFAASIANPEQLYAFDSNAVLSKGKSGLKVGFVALTDSNVPDMLQDGNFNGLEFKATPSMPEDADVDVIVGLSNNGEDVEDADVTIQAPTDGEKVMGAYAIDNKTKEVEEIDSMIGDPDTEVKKMTDELKASVAENEYVAKSDVTFVGKNSLHRSQETTMGDLVTDALYWYADSGKIEGFKKDVPLVAIQNGGNIREPIYNGEITKTDLFNSFPYSPVGVGILYVTGEELLESLEEATQLPDAFPQVAGMKYNVDMDAEYDGSTTKGENGDGQYGNYTLADTYNRVTITSIGGEEFDPKAKYAVVADNMVIANGLNTYGTFMAVKNKATQGEDYLNNGRKILVRDIVAEYLEKCNRTVEEKYISTQGRITKQANSSIEIKTMAAVQAKAVCDKKAEEASDAMTIAQQSCMDAEKMVEEPGQESVDACADAVQAAKAAKDAAVIASKAAQKSLDKAAVAYGADSDKAADAERVKAELDGKRNSAELLASEAKVLHADAKAAKAEKDLKEAKEAADKAVAEAKKNASDSEAAKKAAEDALAKANADKKAAEDALAKANAEKKAAEEAAMKKVKTVTVNVKIVNAKALAKAVKKAKGSSKYVTKFVLGKKVKKIAKGAFKEYAKVKTLQVKTKKLKKKSVKGSLKGSKVKTVQVKIASKKVNKKFVKKYKKIFTKKNAGKKVKVK